MSATGASTDDVEDLLGPTRATTSSTPAAAPAASAATADPTLPDVGKSPLRPDPLAADAVASSTTSAAPASPVSAASPRSARWAHRGPGAASFADGSASPGGASRLLTIPPTMRLIAKEHLKMSKDLLGTGAFSQVITADWQPSEAYIAAVTASSTAAAASGTRTSTTTDEIVRQSSTSSSSSFGPSASVAAPRKVAVKVMNKAAVSRSGFTSLQAEVDICASMNHPSLINTLGIIEDDDNILIIMDLAEGGELFTYTKKFGLEDMPQVAPKFIAEVVLGFEYMAAQGIIHRDIKPENLLLTADYKVKIADFGTAIRVDSEDNRFTGTPSYVSPEVVTTGKASKVSDVWALGCVLYQLFVGRPPFQGDSAYFIMENIKARRFDFPPYFPGDARHLVDQMLIVDPTKRIGANDFQEIKRHVFFRDVNWDTVLTTSNVTFLNENHNARWQKYLLTGERCVFASKIVKERYAGMSIKERMLLLTDYPRLFYLDLDKQEVKGQVPWTDHICAQADNMQQFHVYTGQGPFDRVYHFVDAENHAMIWAAKINEQVKVAKIKMQQKMRQLQAAQLGTTPKSPGSSQRIGSGSLPQDDEWTDTAPAVKKPGK